MHTDNYTVDLESYRISADCSWSELARTTGVSREMLRRFWDEPAEFKLSQLNRIGRHLNVPTAVLRKLVNAA